MVVEDEIRAKGLGVVLDGSIGDEEDAEILNPADTTTYQNLTAKYYRARFEACRDGMWFSMTLNAIFIAWIAWAAWRW
jgi:hypothetical protein